MTVCGVADTAYDQERSHHKGCFVKLWCPCIRFLSGCRRSSRFCFHLRFARSKVGDEKQCQYGNKDHSGQRVHRRFDTAAHFTVDQSGQCIDTCALCEVGDDKIIQRHGECHQETGKYAGHNIRKYHLKERLDRAGTKIQRRLVGIFAGLF